MFSMYLCESASCGGMLLISWFKRVWCEHANFWEPQVSESGDFVCHHHHRVTELCMYVRKRKLYYIYMCSREWWEIEIFINISCYPFILFYLHYIQMNVKVLKKGWQCGRTEEMFSIWKMRNINITSYHVRRPLQSLSRQEASPTPLSAPSVTPFGIYV